MSAFTLEIELVTDWPEPARTALLLSREYWLNVIQGALPSVDVGGRRVDGLLIFAGITPGAPGGTFATGAPEALRPKGAGPAAFLPATARLWLEGADIAGLAGDGRLQRVLIHEIGHCLGFGTEVWTWKELLKGSGGPDPTFVGPYAMAEYGALTGGAPAPVPVENKGGWAAANKHWREKAFGEELMTSYLSSVHNPLSLLTIVSLADLGYQVSAEPAEPYVLPPPGALRYNEKIHLDLPGKTVEAHVLPDTALL